jgi:hypothetical protein
METAIVSFFITGYPGRPFTKANLQKAVAPLLKLIFLQKSGRLFSKAMFQKAVAPLLKLNFLPKKRSPL